MLKNLLLLDIETVPMYGQFDELDAHWQQLFLKKVSKTVPEDTEPADMWLQKAGILAEFGKIVCISTAYFYENEARQLCLKVKSIAGHDEKELLEQFVALCNKMQKSFKDFQFGGHNIKEFDIPYICRRMLIHQVPLPEYLWLHDRKPWEVKMFDTLNWWKFGDNKNYISLDLLANVLGIPTSKTDIDGSMVQYVYYEEADLPRIVAYCQRDVVVVANIILRFKGLPILDNQLVTIVETGA